jgi:hypothetical protein
MCDFYSFSSEIEVTLSFVATIYIFLSPEPSGLSHHRRHEQEPLGGVEKIYTVERDSSPNPHFIFGVALEARSLVSGAGCNDPKYLPYYIFFVIFCFCIIMMS